MPKAIIKPVIVVFSSNSERGGDDQLVGVFDDRTRADFAAKGKGYYGSDGNVREARVVVLEDGEVYLLSEKTKGSIAMNVDLIAKAKSDKEAAKQKLKSALSQEELDILGIKL